MNLINLNINDDKEKSNTIFIILIYLPRVKEENPKEININNDYNYISFLSSINHYFIDNINDK